MKNHRSMWTTMQKMDGQAHADAYIRPHNKHSKCGHLVQESTFPSAIVINCKSTTENNRIIFI